MNKKTNNKGGISGNLWKYLIPIVAVVILIVAIVFFIPVWTIPVAAIENYTVTESRQDPYVNKVTYEASRTAKSEVFYSTPVVIGPGKWAPFIVTSSGLFTFQDWNSIFHGPTAKFTSKPAGMVVFSWQLSGVSQDKVYGVVGADLDVPENVKSDPYGTQRYMIDHALQNKYDRSGSLEFVPSSSVCICAVIHPPTGADINLLLQFSYKWDEVTYGTKDEIKVRDVPVQVEKQRTVIKEEKGSLWKLLFSK